MKFIFQLPMRVTAHRHDETALEANLEHKSDEVLRFEIEAEDVEGAKGVVRVVLGQLFGSGVVRWAPERPIVRGPGHKDG